MQKPDDKPFLKFAFRFLGGAFDALGNLKNWWSKEAGKRFDKKCHCFVEQYSDYYFPEANATINGNQTLGENIADNGGVRESYRALQSIKKEMKLQKLPGKLSNFTDEQIFFLAYANVSYVKLNK